MGSVVRVNLVNHNRRLYGGAFLCELAGRTPTGAIEGSIPDRSGAVVTGVKFTVTDVATRQMRPVITHDSARSAKLVVQATCEFFSVSPEIKTRSK